MNAITQFGNRAIDGTRLILLSLGLLALRLGFGGMMVYGHGWGKLMSFGERADKFPDPLGVGSPVSLALVVFAEVFCSLAVIVGLATRAAAVPLIGAMGVAAVVIHADDPFEGKEKALLFLTAFIALALTGPGRYSLDGLIGGWLTKRRGTPEPR